MPARSFGTARREQSVSIGNTCEVVPVAAIVAVFPAVTCWRYRGPTTVLYTTTVLASMLWFGGDARGVSKDSPFLMTRDCRRAWKGLPVSTVVYLVERDTYFRMSTVRHRGGNGCLKKTLLSWLFVTVVGDCAKQGNKGHSHV